MTCPICGGVKQCVLTHGQMGDIDFLSKEDWMNIYHFLRGVELPFMHHIIAEAARRKGIPKERLNLMVHGFRPKRDEPKP